MPMKRTGQGVHHGAVAHSDPETSGVGYSDWRHLTARNLQTPFSEAPLADVLQECSLPVRHQTGRRESVSGGARVLFCSYQELNDANDCAISRFHTR